MGKIGKFGIASAAVVSLAATLGMASMDEPQRETTNIGERATVVATDTSDIRYSQEMVQQEAKVLAEAAQRVELEQQKAERIKAEKEAAAKKKAEQKAEAKEEAERVAAEEAAIAEAERIAQAEAERVAAQQAQAAKVPAPAPKPAPAVKEAPAPAAPVAPAVTNIHVVGAGGQGLVDQCIGPVWFTPVDITVSIAEHDYCGGAARFLHLSNGDAVNLTGAVSGSYVVRDSIVVPTFSREGSLSAFGTMPPVFLQTCIPGTNQMKLIGLYPA